MLELTGSIRGLTLHRPWPWAFIHAGKRVENRTWAPHDDAVGEYLALHAGLAWDYESATNMKSGHFNTAARKCPMSEQFHPKGAIVAVARLRTYGEYSLGSSVWNDVKDDPWAFGPVVWMLDSFVALSTPVKCRGAQGLWKVPDEVIEQVMMNTKNGPRDHG